MAVWAAATPAAESFAARGSGSATSLVVHVGEAIVQAVAEQAHLFVGALGALGEVRAPQCPREHRAPRLPTISRAEPRPWVAALIRHPKGVLVIEALEASEAIKTIETIHAIEAIEAIETIDAIVNSRIFFLFPNLL